MYMEKDYTEIKSEIKKRNLLGPSSAFGHKTGGRKLKINNETELERNWKSNSKLNANDSDHHYKYHVANLSHIYHNPGNIDNVLPRSLKKPPIFYTSNDLLDPNDSTKRKFSANKLGDSFRKSL